MRQDDGGRHLGNPGVKDGDEGDRHRRAADLGKDEGGGGLPGDARERVRQRASRGHRRVGEAGRRREEVGAADVRPDRKWRRARAPRPHDAKDNEQITQVATIATEVKDLAARAKDGKLAPHEYQGGTASISNMGMFGIKHFTAVINPPQAMIMAVGAGERRPYVVNDELTVATVMSATGSFDHRAIDGAVGAQLMAAFKRLVENPLGMLA